MSEDREKGRPAIEWVFGAASAIVVIGIVAFLAYQAAFERRRSPELAATIEKLEQVGNGTLVVIAVSNRGEEAAANVGVAAVVTRGGEQAAAKEIVFDYVAAHAVRRGAFVVEGQDVGEEDLRLTIHGYVEP